MKNANFPSVIKFTTAIMLALTVLCCLLYYESRHAVLLSVAISFGTTAYHFAMRLAVGAIVPKTTNYDFDYHSFWFQSRTWEPAVYQKLRVKEWKGKLPTYDPDQFSLKTNTLHRIIQNMCGAEIVHELIMVLSFIPLAAVPILGALPVFLVTSILASGFDGLFVIAQRYNRPRLVRIYEKQIDFPQTKHFPPQEGQDPPL